MVEEMIGLDIEKVDDLTLVDYESRGYPKSGEDQGC